MIYKIYKSLLILSYIFYFLLLIGLSFLDEVYYNSIVLILQFIIAVYILIIFRPLSKKQKISDNERQLIFASGFYLLISVIPIYKIINYWSIQILLSNKITSKLAKYIVHRREKKKKKEIN